MSVYSQIASAERMAAQRAKQDMQMMQLQMKQSQQDQQHFSEEMDKQRAADTEARKDMMEMMREQNQTQDAEMKEIMGDMSKEPGTSEYDPSEPGGKTPTIDTKDIKSEPTQTKENVSYA